MDLAGILKEVLERLEKVHQATGVPPHVMMAVGVVMFGAWTACYLVIIVRCFKQKTYGIPVINSSLNICWEFIFSFNLAGALSEAIRWGNRFWLIPDTFIVLQTFLYGKDQQTHPWVKKHFYTIVTLTLIACFIGEYQFLIYFNDLYGVLLSLLIDFLMSALFLNMALQRTDLRGIPLSGTCFKMIGNVASVIFLCFWWPSQFVNGELHTTIDGIHPVVVPEPPSWGFMYFLYVCLLALDGLLIYLVWKRGKEIRAEAVGTAASVALEGRA
jgi:hypothetical protein